MNKAQGRRSHKNKDKYARQYIRTFKNAVKKLTKLIKGQPANKQLEEKLKKLEKLKSGERIKKKAKKRHKI